MAIGTTVFPTGLGQAATFNTELIEKMGKVIGEELRLQGAHIAYGPILDLAREPRWSRVEETYGEDPILVARMGEAMVTGLGGGDVTQPGSAISTLKHRITSYNVCYTKLLRSRYGLLSFFDALSLCDGTLKANHDRKAKTAGRISDCCPKK